MESVSLLPVISISIILSLRRDTCNERERGRGREERGERGKEVKRERERGEGGEREGGRGGERGKEVPYLGPLEATKLSNNINFSL